MMDMMKNMLKASKKACDRYYLLEIFKIDFMDNNIFCYY